MKLERQIMNTRKKLDAMEIESDALAKNKPRQRSNDA